MLGLTLANVRTAFVRHAQERIFRAMKLSSNCRLFHLYCSDAPTGNVFSVGRRIVSVERKRSCGTQYVWRAHSRKRMPRLRRRKIDRHAVDRRWDMVLLKKLPKR